MRALVVDAGVGNLGNLERALRHLGAACQVSADPQEIAAARCLLLPGVGAFRPPRETLRGAMEDALRHALDQGCWLLGICVGFQLLFERGEEFGTTDGLGLLPGTVRRLPGSVALPHIGWNRLRDERPHPLFAGIPAGSHFYFVHSYALLADPAPEEASAGASAQASPFDTVDGVCLARATHGASFVAVAGRGRVLGTQFHPERSGRVGLALLRNYLQLAHAPDPGD